ncbi:MAG: carbohydrate kinase family protein [Spirochaetales bacterium]|nr:carbohydrate kinase family protein [Spirochaetales bacterium]
MADIWVVGASNVDIIARSTNEIIAADSNVGTVEKAPGGVGRNIAEALKALGFDVTFVTALADDEYGRYLAKNIRKTGIKLCDELLPADENHTGVYCCIHDKDGDLVCAVNDMRINDKLDPNLIEKHNEGLKSADYVVFDTNLPKQTIESLTALDGVKLVVDCVSSIKAAKLSDVLESLYLLKANFIEACALAEIEAVQPDSEALEAVMSALVSKGLKRAIISLGEDGAFCYELSGTGIRGVDAKVFPNLNVVSTNGCGDVLLAGYLRAISEGFPMEDALWYGQAASGINSESMEAVSPNLNFGNVRKKVEEYYEQIS